MELRQETCAFNGRSRLYADHCITFISPHTFVFASARVSVYTFAKVADKLLLFVMHAGQRCTTLPVSLMKVMCALFSVNFCNLYERKCPPCVLMCMCLGAS